MLLSCSGKQERSSRSRPSTGLFWGLVRVPRAHFGLSSTCPYAYVLAAIFNRHVIRARLAPRMPARVPARQKA
jgi:hypothetical protein